MQSSAWILVASFLATMNISKTVDANGKQIEPEIKYENSIFRWGEQSILRVWAVADSFDQESPRNFT